MSWLGLKIASWVLHAVVVMVSVAAVSPKNPVNTLGRALMVTFVVALLVTPFAWFWFLLVPGIIALVVWCAVYSIAYGIGFFQALVAGLVQVALGVGIDYLLPPHPHY
jgi:hypothetical protein